MRSLSFLIACLAITPLACKSKSSTGGPAPAASTPPFDAGPVQPETPAPECRGEVATAITPQTNLTAAPALNVANGFSLELVARIDSARHLVALPNGDLLVGTGATAVYLLPGAEADGMPGAPIEFAKFSQAPAHGVTFAKSTCSIYVATPQSIYKLPYRDGQTVGEVGAPIARVRPNGSGGHTSTSLTFLQDTLFASVGSSCNACVESDPTRATVQSFAADGSNMTLRARRIRNAIALTVNPETGSVWAGGAGQDDLPDGHPYEFLDPITAHGGVPDYGWPDCEENRVAYRAGADCSQTVAPRIVMPAYATIIGAAFYPTNQSGTFAFPAGHRGLFMTAHGSWHEAAGKYVAAPRVVFVAMNGDTPQVPVDWNDPNKQLTDFVSGFELADGVSRVGRPSGLAIGSRGSLFIGDDHIGAVYRVRAK